MTTKARHTANLVDANGDVQTTHLDNVPNEVAVSASAPSSPNEGDLWYDTTNEILKVYNATDSAFIKVVTVTPVLSSVNGNILSGSAGNLDLVGSGFLTSNLIVGFTPSGGSTSNVTVTPTSDLTATVAIPSAIYGQSVGTTIGIKVTNNDAKISGTVNKTVSTLPTGGTISTISGYRIHTFNSSANFVTTDTRTIEYLIVAGGGGGGWDVGGGGGAGGMLTGSVIKSADTYSIVVGAGGAGAPNSTTQNSGTNSTALGFTALGGGAGGNWTSGGSTRHGLDGGSGGGAGGWNQSANGGNGTFGQGNDGGDAPTASAGKSGGGGGGAGGAGQDEQGTNSSDTALAGVGLASSITGSSVTYAIGGTGGNDFAYGSQADGETNKGGGGDGAGIGNPSAGGSGVVILRYAV